MKTVIETQICPEVPFVLLEESLNPRRNVVLFDAPHQIIEANAIDEVVPAFEAIEAALAEGHHVAGYMNYELGLALEPRLQHRLKENTQLLWFGVFREKILTTNQFFKDWLDRMLPEHPGSNIADNLSIAPGEDFASYEARFNTVKEAISAGDIYQMNLTFKAEISGIDNPLALYKEMRRNQPVSFASLIMTGRQTILSASPELFIENEGGQLETRPMKGTLKRAPLPEQDQASQNHLQQDEKSRAENLMIVDLMRNDLSRIAESGTVEVPDLFKVETYNSLHQMISVVRAKQIEGLPLIDQMRALFPPGSVTGAPKIRAMELIDELETEPRGIYTGAIGYFAPGGDYCFNVAIRTISISDDGRAEIGIGSGLVNDSKPREEYDECLLKMQFLKSRTPDFHLLETLAFNPVTGIILKKEHIERLCNSACYFSIPVEAQDVETLLNQIVNGSETPMRLRLLLSKSGDMTISTSELDMPDENDIWPVSWASQPVDKNNVFLYHKTTHRTFYDTARADVQKNNPAIREVLFCNQDGQVTEGSFTNIFIERDGILLTPPVSDGLLQGTLREDLIASGAAIEQSLTKTDISQADCVYIGNSVRGLVRAKLIEATGS